jgi:hypothetical protein
MIDDLLKFRRRFISLLQREIRLPSDIGNVERRSNVRDAGLPQFDFLRYNEFVESLLGIVLINGDLASKRRKIIRVQ